MLKRVPLKRQIQDKIVRCWKRQVFLRTDFKPISEDYDQIGRALLTLTREGKLIRIGYGLYAKARLNRITGQPMLDSEGGFTQVAKEALDLLGVTWQPSSQEQNYNKDDSMQIPINAQIIIKTRFKRKIGTEKFNLKVQQN
jgi:hypothetical protein